MEQTGLRRIIKLAMQVRQGIDLTPAEGAELDQYQKRHPESKEFIGAIARGMPTFDDLVGIATFTGGHAVSIEALKENCEVMDPCEILEHLNRHGYEVALLSWRRQYCVASFSWKEQMEEDEKQFVYENNDNNWHATPKEAVIAYLDKIDN